MFHGKFDVKQMVSYMWSKNLWPKINYHNSGCTVHSLLCEIEKKKSQRESFNPFTADNAKSKINNLAKTTNWLKLKNKQSQTKVWLNIDSFSMSVYTLGVPPIESKVIKLCIIQSFTLGFKGLNGFFFQF